MRQREKEQERERREGERERSRGSTARSVVGSTRLRDRHVTNPTSGYSALFFSCTSCMGTSTSKVGETETGRGGHGKGATKWSDEHEEEPEHWERQHDGYKTTTKDKDNYDKGMATKTRQLRGQWQRNTTRGH